MQAGHKYVVVLLLSVRWRSIWRICKYRNSACTSLVLIRCCRYTGGSIDVRADHADICTYAHSLWHFPSLCTRNASYVTTAVVQVLHPRTTSTRVRAATVPVSKSRGNRSSRVCSLKCKLLVTSVGDAERSSRRYARTVKGRRSWTTPSITR